MFWRAILLIVGLMGPLETSLGAPYWWHSAGISTSTADNKAAATVGQVKYIAKAAWEHLEAYGGAGFTLSYTPHANDKDAAVIGHLKAAATPFFNRLNAIGYSGSPPHISTIYPWSSSTGDNKVVATIGQLKYVFSFDLTDPYDWDGDGVRNGWDNDIDGDGIANEFDDDIDGDGQLNGADADQDGDGTNNGSDETPQGPTLATHHVVTVTYSLSGEEKVGVYDQDITVWETKQSGGTVDIALKRGSAYYARISTFGENSSGSITINVNSGPWITVDHQTGNLVVTINAGENENRELDLLPVELYSDLNNDGELTSADSGLVGKPYASSASEEEKDKGTEFMFANDNLSNGAWDKQDSTTPGKPADADDDDAEELYINPGITEGEVWLNHPAIAGLKFYRDKKCTQPINLSPSQRLTISVSNPFPEKVFVRAESVSFTDTNNPQVEGDLKLMVKPPGGAANGVEATKIKLTIIKDLRAKKYFHGARDRIFENNVKFFAHDKIYGTSRKFRLCLMREEGSTMYSIDTFHRQTPLAGIDAVVGAYPQLSVVVNGNICFFSDPPLFPTAGHMTDKCHGGMVRFGTFDTNVSSHDAAKSSLAGPDAKYVAQYDQPKRYEFVKGRVPETPAGMEAALGGLSTNPNEPDRIDREFQMIGYYPSTEQGKGIVFTATQIDGDGGGAQFVDDAKESGVPTNATDGGRPLVFLLDGGTSTAVAHSSPNDQLNVIVKGAKHTWVYKINTYLLFHCEKPRAN